MRQEKLKFSVQWDYKGIVYFELLPKNCLQVDKLNSDIQEKLPDMVNCKGVVFPYYNVIPHTSSIPRQKLLICGWEVMLHPSFSPGLEPLE